MQDIGPDMEDLLRKASANYPLKQSADRWDDIASGINQFTEPKTAARSLRYKKLWIVLGLLLMFLFIQEFILKQKQIADQFYFPGKQATGTQKNTVTASRYIPGLENIKVVAEGDKNKIIGSLNTKNAIALRKAGMPAAGDKVLNTNQNKRAGHADNTKVQLMESTYVLSDLQPNAVPYEHKLKMAPQTKNRLSARGIYFGLLAGPQFNTVKNQGLRKAGLSAGIIAGYRFNNKLSIETGLWLSKKFYSTTGEHFSMKEIGPAMPAAMKVMEVDGSTRFLEIPVNIRLDVFQKRKQNIYTLAGLSSHIIDQEANQYHTVMNGTEEMMYGTYKKNRSYFASSLNLALGYEHTLGKHNKLRIQPYVQLPLKGVGVGSLQIRSAGIHIGITRQGD